MSLYESVYTNTISDFIGNDPVLDQFDIFYAASYYGTMQDNYVTGSLLNKVQYVMGRPTFTIGSRGRYFSKFYVSSQLQLDSTYGSAAVSKNPSLSFRLNSLESRVSRADYRLIQCIDDSERYYDSCLPNMGIVLALNESKIWSIENRLNAFSPYVNVVTSSVGYLFFDSIEVDRTPAFSKDPTVLNGWTRSFPYESRYSTANRQLSTDAQLGLGNKSLTLNWDSPKKNDTVLYTITGSSEFFGIADKTYDVDITSMTRDDISLSNLATVLNKQIKAFIPIVPGLLHKNHGDKFINGLRQKTFHDGGYGKVAISMGEYQNESVENETGYSLLLASDVDLSKKIAHTEYLMPFEAPDPGLEYVTGSMYTTDLIKFLFGFGDLNNVTYGRRTYDVAKKKLVYNESFENYLEGTLTKNIPQYKDKYFELNWGNYGTEDSIRHWRVSARDDEIVAPLGAEDRNTYFFKSGSKPDSLIKGIKWISGSSDFKVLVSATSKHLNNEFEVPSGSFLSDSTYSAFFLDITASYPWSFSYDRAICGNTSDSLDIAFTGAPGTPTDIYGKNNPYPYLYIEHLTGSVIITDPPHAGGLIKMKTWDSMTDNMLTGSVFNKEYPLPAGRWQIIWVFSSGSSLTTNPSFAAINNLKFYTFADLKKDQMIGSNNLPDFAIKATDGRIDPTYKPSALNDGPWASIPEVSSLHLSSTSNMYKSYAFGVSPIIRGWKYGLVNGYPQHTKAIYRRAKYGQLRDMLEQRQDTKFVSINSSPLDFDAVTVDNFNKELQTTLTKQTTANGFSGVSDGVVTVNFVAKITKIDNNGAGKILTRNVSPAETTSQNLSYEVTSSLPYFDGEARHRTYQELRVIKVSSFVDTST